MLNNTFGLVDVLDLAFFDFNTKEELLSIKYAESVKLGVDGEQLKVKGGIGNPTRLTVGHSKSATFAAEVPLVSIESLGVKLGKKVKVGKTRAPMSEEKEVAGGKIELAFKPISGTIKIYKLKTNGKDIENPLALGDPTNIDEYSITDSVMTVHSDLDGRMVRVHYDYMTGENASNIRVTAKDFPNPVRITGKGYALDEDGNKALMTLEVFKATPTSAFEMTFKSGEATTLNLDSELSAVKRDGELSFFELIPQPDTPYEG